MRNYDARLGSILEMKFPSDQVESEIFNSISYHIVIRYIKFFLGGLGIGKFLD